MERGGLLLVWRAVLLANSVADVLKNLALSSLPPLFFFDGEIKFLLKLSCLLTLFGKLLLQNPAS